MRPDGEQNGTHPQPSAPEMGTIRELVVRYHELKCKYTLSMGL